MEIINPFPVSAYQGPEFFCDRKKELKKLNLNITNGIHTTLLSVRRMGKTGLIRHLFNELSRKKNIHCLYLDIYATQSQKDFLNQLSTALVQAFPAKKKWGKLVLDFITGLRPVISYDNLTGQPEISFASAPRKQQEHSLSQLFSFLDGLDAIIVIAIDEFQQIEAYPEKNTEALLRTLIQPLKNLRFIFSGSSKHILSQMFGDKKRPFFGSTQMLELQSIAQKEYEKFIEGKFAQHKRKIEPAALEFISEWTRLHTYYTQVVCNRVFAESEKNITKASVQLSCSRLLDEQQAIFFQYRTLLTSAQWQLLKAIAKTDKLYQPNSKTFIAANALGTPSNVQRSLEALLTKEMIFREFDDGGSYYRVYDCFLARWLERMM